jgi:hypothetical protein
MIVKVQLPLSSSEADPPALVYDQARTWQFYMEVTKELRARMKGRDKAFFNAERCGGKVVLLDEAPWQDW